MGDIFREIDEELRQEHYEKLWRKYGKYVLGAALAIVLLVAGIMGWRDYQASQREADGLKFYIAIKALEGGKTEDASAILGSLAKNGGAGYGLLSRFHEAAILAKKGDLAGASAIYDAIAADQSVDRHLRDLALVLLGYNSIGSGDAAALTARLQPLTDAGNPWRLSALEAMGFLAQRSGDSAKAKEYFRRITDDVDAPSNMRARAAQFLDMIGG